MRKLPNYPRCFVCGQETKAGISITWIKTEVGVQGEYLGEEKHVGFEGLIHGGIISSLLDECVGWAVAISEKKICVTSELNIKYLKFVPVGKKLIVKGVYSPNQPVEKKFHSGFGSIEDDSGKIYATCEGKFFPMPRKMEAAYLEKMSMSDDVNQKITLADIWK